MRNAVKLLAWLVVIALLLAVGVGAQAPTGDLDVVQLRPNFYVIGGAGGNVVVQLGPEGVILVDSGSTERADRVLAAIESWYNGHASEGGGMEEPWEPE